MVRGSDKMAKHIEGLYEIAKEYEKKHNEEECYHRLAALCDSIMNIDRFQFELDQFSLDEKKLFINAFIEILESDKVFVRNIYKAQQEKKYPNKKILFTLKKEDVDNSLDSFMKVFLQLGYQYYGNGSFAPILNTSREHIISMMVEEITEYRNIIRHTNGSPREKFVKCYQSFMSYFNKFISSSVIDRNNGMYNLLDTLYVLYKAMNLFADFYFQTVLYLIIDNVQISKQDTLNMMNKLVDFSEKLEVDFVPRTDKAEKHNIFDSFAVYIMYLNYRNTYKNVIEIQELLVKQMSDEKYVKSVMEQYQCKERWLEDVNTKKDFRNIVLEGKEDKEERFNKNLEDVQHLMSLLYTITGRELGAEYLQHVKVVYREIIEDDLKYNNKQSRTIMRNIEKKELPYFESERETFFIREKISRGLMREKGYAEEYILKNRLQASFYNAVLNLFTSYDELRIAKDARQLYSKYARELLRVLE